MSINELTALRDAFDPDIRLQSERRCLASGLLRWEIVG